MEQRYFENFTDEPLDEEERRLMDPDNWENDAVPGDSPLAEIVLSPDLGFILQVRFTKDEFRRLAKCARREDRLTTQLIREAALAYVDQSTAQPAGQQRA